MTSKIEKCLDACKQIGINQPHFAIVIDDARKELADLQARLDHYIGTVTLCSGSCKLLEGDPPELDTDKIIYELNKDRMRLEWLCFNPELIDITETDKVAGGYWLDLYENYKGSGRVGQILEAFRAAIDSAREAQND